MYSTILFDLDGTLTDPYLGITNSIMYALEKLGREIPPREQLLSFIGPPLYDEFVRKFGMDDAEATEAVRLYREYYPQKGLYENAVIDGTEQLLAVLKLRQKRVCLATSKPEPYAREILRYFELLHYFDFIGAAQLDGSISTKKEVLCHVLNSVKAEPEECLLVGDRMHDIEGAHSVGMKCVGFLCGYGSKEELVSHGADYLAETPADVLKFV